MSKTYDRSLEEGQLLARGHDHKCRMHKRGEVRAVVLSIVVVIKYAVLLKSMKLRDAWAVF